VVWSQPTRATAFATVLFSHEALDRLAIADDELVFNGVYSALPSSSGSLAKFNAIRLASSRVSSPAVRASLSVSRA